MVDSTEAAASGAPALTPAQRARRRANRRNLSTPLGLLLARVGRAQTRPGTYGLVLAERSRLAFARAGAFTVGDVVLTSGTFDELLRAHPRLLVHEEVHARQWSRCAGLPFLPLYAVATAWSWVRTGDRASANVFERRAGLLNGGYREQPVRGAGELARIAGARLRLRRPARRVSGGDRRSGPGGLE